jgi:hypothetical protein
MALNTRKCSTSCQYLTPGLPGALKDFFLFPFPVEEKAESEIRNVIYI